MNIFMNAYRNVDAICGAYKINKKNGEMYAKCGFSLVSNQTQRLRKCEERKKANVKRKEVEEEEEEIDDDDDDGKKTSLRLYCLRFRLLMSCMLCAALEK